MEGNYLDLLFFTALVLAVAVVVPLDMWMLRGWRVSYFSSGLCLFEKTFQTTSSLFDPLDAAAIEEEFASGLFPPIGVRELSTGLYGFRELYLSTNSSFLTYLPVMRGAVVFDSTAASISVKGYLNRYVIVVSALVVFMTLPLEPRGESTVVLVAYFAILLVVHLVQRWRYGSVARMVEEAVGGVR